MSPRRKAETRPDTAKKDYREAAEPLREPENLLEPEAAAIALPKRPAES